MDKTTLAYLAGVIDSDGCVTISRRRHKDGGSGWSYYPRIEIKQVELQAVSLAKEVFGGNLQLNPAAAPTRRPIYCWQAVNARAVKVAKSLLPYMRIKREQTLLLIEYGKVRSNHSFRRRSYWYKMVPGEPVCDPSEAAMLKGVSRASVYQAISNGSVPVMREGRRVFIPRAFWDSYEMKRGQHALPPEYIALREQFHARMKVLNRVGPR